MAKLAYPKGNGKPTSAPITLSDIPWPVKGAFATILFTALAMPFHQQIGQALQTLLSKLL